MHSSPSTSLSSSHDSQRLGSDVTTSSSQQTPSSDKSSQPSVEDLQARLLKEKKKSSSKLSSFMKSPKHLLRRFASAPTIKTNEKRRLYTVAEQEDAAFKRQLAELEEPPEWDLNAGVGSENFETPSQTPPPVTTSRATSPSRVVDKVAESSKKGIQRLVAIVMESPPRDAAYDKNNLASRSLPDLSTSSGKGHAGSITNSPPQEPRGRGRTPRPVDDRHRNHHHFPHSWRIPPQSALGRGPHIRESVPLPSFPFGQIKTKNHEFTVMARAMWKNGEIRYEDQWGRRIVPVGRQDSFMFELWPVAEDGEVEDVSSSLSTATINEEPDEVYEAAL